MRYVFVLLFLALFGLAYKQAFAATSWPALIAWWLFAMVCFGIAGSVLFSPPKVARSNKPRHIGFSIWV